MLIWQGVRCLGKEKKDVIKRSPRVRTSGDLLLCERLEQEPSQLQRPAQQELKALLGQGLLGHLPAAGVER